jgi:hypothetical protein
VLNILNAGGILSAFVADEKDGWLAVRPLKQWAVYLLQPVGSTHFRPKLTVEFDQRFSVEMIHRKCLITTTG